MRVTNLKYRYKQYDLSESLTLRSEQLKSEDLVSAIQDSFYARWRVESGAVLLLREDTESPPERLLQVIWQHQRLLRDQLSTLDGQQLRVLHPGFHNLEGGPDFRQAIIQMGEGPPRQGDVELDLRASGWHAHGHDRNPAFQATRHENPPAVSAGHYRGRPLLFQTARG